MYGVFCIHNYSGFFFSFFFLENSDKIVISSFSGKYLSSHFLLISVVYSACL